MSNSIKLTTSLSSLPNKDPLVVQSLLERIEEKYFIEALQLSSLLKTLHHHLPMDEFHQNTAYHVIRSIYFDSAQLSFFYNHQQNAQERAKLRLRYYGPDGFFSHDTPVLLELKEKKQSVTKKRRLSLTTMQAEKLCHRDLQEQQVSELFCALKNNGGSKKSLHAEQFYRLLTDQSLFPVEEITYKRKAYEQKGLRITVDWDLQSQALLSLPSCPLVTPCAENLSPQNSYACYKNLQPSIIEIKHHGHIPHWVTQEIIEKFSAQPVKFSKYCYGIYKDYC